MSKLRSKFLGGCMTFVLAIVLATLAPADEPGQDAKKAPPQAANDRDNGKLLFDGKSLTGWKSTNFGGEGEVRVADGAVVMEQGSNMTGITYTRGDFPRMD